MSSWFVYGPLVVSEHLKSVFLKYDLRIIVSAKFCRGDFLTWSLYNSNVVSLLKWPSRAQRVEILHRSPSQVQKPLLQKTVICDHYEPKVLAVWSGGGGELEKCIKQWFPNFLAKV